MLNMILSRLINQPMPGADAGRCALCGEHTEHGLARLFSKDFTAYAYIYGGNVVCQYCAGMLLHKPFRTRSWIATTGGVEYIESGDGRLKLREALLHPPEPPFAIYISRNHQRQGWLTLMRRVSLSRDRFYVGNDWLDSPAYIVRDQFVLLLSEAEAMLARKVPRSVLLRESEPSVQLVKRAVQERWMGQLQRAMERAGDPAWEVAVYVGRSE